MAGLQFANSMEGTRNEILIRNNFDNLSNNSYYRNQICISYSDDNVHEFLKENELLKE